MKKFISIVLALVMLMALCVPAFAEDDVIFIDEATTIEGTQSYDELCIYAPAIIGKDANITANALYISTNSLTVKSGATVNVEILQIDQHTSMTVESGATVNVEILQIDQNTSMTVESGATVNIQGDPSNQSLSVMGTLTIAGELLGNNIDNLVLGSGKIISLQPGGIIDATFSDDMRADYFYDILSSEYCVANDGNRVVAVAEHNYVDGVCTNCNHRCKNRFHNGVCPDCGMSASAGLVGSVLSDGNMAIIIGIAALVIGFGGGFILGRKKKTAE